MNLKKQLTLIEKELSGFTRDEKALQKEINATEAELVKLPSGIKEQLEKSETVLEETRQTYSNIAGDQKAVLGEIAKLNKQLTDIQDFGPESVCDRCHRPLGDDLRTIKAHFQAELDKFRETERNLADKLTQIKPKAKNFGIKQKISSRRPVRGLNLNLS